MITRAGQTFVPAPVQGELIQDLIVGCRLPIYIQVQPTHLQEQRVSDQTQLDQTEFTRSHVASHLFGRPPQTLSDVAHPALTDQHALRPSKAPEGCVGRQVGAAHVTATTYVWNTVRVFHVEQGALHDLHKRTQANISTSSTNIGEKKKSRVGDSTHRQREVHGVSSVTVVRHVQSHDLSTVQVTHLEQVQFKQFNLIKLYSTQFIVCYTFH